MRAKPCSKFSLAAAQATAETAMLAVAEYLAKEGD
jgi:hypothetical protein